MDASRIQIGLDIGTALSVIGASYAFIYNNIRENRRDRKLRSDQFKIERISEVIKFLNEKLHESIQISSKINDQLNSINIEFSMLTYSMNWESPDVFPERFSIYKLVSRLEEEVLLPIIITIENFPFSAVLDGSVRDEFSSLVAFAKTYFEEECRGNFPISSEISYVEQEPSFAGWL